MQTDTAHRRLRELILDGTYQPGARLTELDVAAQLEMSRTPVREALHALAADGLVQPSGRGVTVVELAPEELQDAYQVRAALEGLTAELAAGRQRDGRIAPADLRALQEIADAAAAATSAGRLAEGVGHNRAFHRRIAELSGNAMALQALDRVWDLIHVSTLRSLRQTARTAHVSGQHDKLLAAIVEGRGDDAGRVAREHVLDTHAAAGKEERRPEAV
jgi:DNA-binding GntR family transcriptional regulator